MAQWVKDLVLSLLGHGFDSWPRNFCMSWMRPKKKKKRMIQIKSVILQTGLLSFQAPKGPQKTKRVSEVHEIILVFNEPFSQIIIVHCVFFP